MKWTTCIAVFTFLLLPLTAVAGDYSPVTAERLANPETPELAHAEG